MIRVISSSSSDRIRKISVPITSNLATPTSPMTTPTAANTGPEKAVHKKVSLPSGPPRLKALPPSRLLDTSEVIRKLKMEQSDASPTSSSVSVRLLAVITLVCVCLRLHQLLPLSLSLSPPLPPSPSLPPQVPYVEVNLDRYPGRRYEMQERTGRRTVPQIFFNNKHIGGFDDLKKLVRTNMLI